MLPEAGRSRRGPPSPRLAPLPEGAGSRRAHPAGSKVHTTSAFIVVLTGGRQRAPTEPYRLRARRAGRCPPSPLPRRPGALRLPSHTGPGPSPTTGAPPRGPHSAAGGGAPIPPAPGGRAPPSPAIPRAGATSPPPYGGCRTRTEAGRGLLSPRAPASRQGKRPCRTTSSSSAATGGTTEHCNPHPVTPPAQPARREGLDGRRGRRPGGNPGGAGTKPGTARPFSGAAPLNPTWPPPPPPPPGGARHLAAALLPAPPAVRPRPREPLPAETPPPPPRRRRGGGHGGGRGGGAVQGVRGSPAVLRAAPRPAARSAGRPTGGMAGGRPPRAGCLGVALHHRPHVEVPGQVHGAARGHEEDGRPRPHRWAGGRGRAGPGGRLPGPACSRCPLPAGRIRVRGIGGGHKRRYRMIDFQRLRYEEGAPPEPFTEKVINVRYDPCRRVQGAGSGQLCACG